MFKTKYRKALDILDFNIRFEEDMIKHYEKVVDEWEDLDSVAYDVYSKSLDESIYAMLAYKKLKKELEKKLGV